MKLEIKKTDGIDVVFLPSYIGKDDYGILRDLIGGFVSSGQLTVMVDCRQSPNGIPSAVFGVFCALGSLLNDRGGVLGLVGLSGHMKMLAKTISMDKYVAMFDSLEEAVKICSEKI